MWNHADLVAGNQKELEVIPYIVAFYKSRGKKKVEVKLNDAEDLAGKQVCDLIDNFGIKWEVKYDRRYKDTGNVFIEHAALKHSGADFYIFCLDNHLPIMVSKDLLMATIEDNLASGGLGKYRIVPKGANNDEGTVLPLDDLLKIGKVLDGEKRRTKVKREPAVALSRY